MPACCSVHHLQGTTPWLITSLNSARAAAAPSAAIAGQDDAEDEDEDEDDDINSPGYQNPDLYGGRHQWPP